jgi:hypothetical protein
MLWHDNIIHDHETDSAGASVPESKGSGRDCWQYTAKAAGDGKSR